MNFLNSFQVSCISAVLLFGCKKSFPPESSHTFKADSVINIYDKANRVDLESNSNALEPLGELAEAIRKDEPRLLESVVGDGGFSLIRNFTSGTLGARGTNFRTYIPVHLKMHSLSFPVENESPIRLGSIFQTLTGAGGQSCPQFRNDSLGFAINDDPSRVDPPTDSLIASINEVLLHADSTVDCFSISLEGRYLLYAENGQSIEGIPVGSFAVFKNEGSRYHLRGIIDFR